jgi:hypothetical protein
VRTIDSPSSGGRAAYSFNVPAAGSYIIKARVRGTSGGADSFFINIDAEPTNPGMIWDITNSPDYQMRTVSWRGNGTAGRNEFVPKVFNLGAGQHTLILRGREPGTRIDRLFIERQ